jgi:hypothetical protein
LIQAFAQAQKAIGWGIMDFRQIDFGNSSGRVLVNGSFEAAAFGKMEYTVCD